MEIIGLSGFARSGKDEAAKILVEEFGFKQVAFADKLREVLYALNPLVVGYDKHGIANTEPRFLQYIIGRYGWNGYKETPYGTEIRRLLQRLGTEAGRQTLWDSIWIDAAFSDVEPDDKIVISDGRFFNEFDAIRERGGRVWRIERTGVGPANNHASELEAVDYPHFSYTIWNDSDLATYREQIKQLYAGGF